MEIYIIRHGETRWNRERKLQGRADIPLNENGIALAARTGIGMKDIPFDFCFSSPLLRAKQTAWEILKKNEGYRERTEAFLKENPEYRSQADTKSITASAGEEHPIICTDPRIIEINFGPWEGLGCGADNYELPVADFRDFFVRPDEFVMPEGAETVQSVEKRAEDFLKDLFSREELQDKTILVTTHGCAMSSLLLPFYRDEDPASRPPIPHNCQVARIEALPGRKPVLADRGRTYYE